jgi:hypothetical protein
VVLDFASPGLDFASVLGAKGALGALTVIGVHLQ